MDKQKILVADDEPGVRLTLRRMLENAGDERLYVYAYHAVKTGETPLFDILNPQPDS